MSPRVACYFLLKDIFTYVLVASLYVLFVLSWWSVRDFILPSREIRATVTSPRVLWDKTASAFEPAALEGLKQE